MSENYKSTAVFVVSSQGLSAQQKAAKMTYLFMTGGEYTTAQVSDILGMSYGGASRLLENISYSIPIYCEGEADGRWRMTATATSGSRWRSFSGN